MSAAPLDRRTISPAGSGTGYVAERVTAQTLDAASLRLIGATAGPVGRAAGQRFLVSARKQNIDLSRFWIVRRGKGKRVIAAVLLAPSTGGTGMVFTSSPGNAEETRALIAGVEAACGVPEGVLLAQSLIEPGDIAIRRAVEACGFGHVGDLYYMKRVWRPVAPAVETTPMPEGVTITPWREGDDADVVRALERTYIDTLDCPELCGIRRTEDVLESHRGAGVWSPELWWVIRKDDSPEGVVLFTEFPDQGHAELVYLGLGPALRGMGLGGRVLRFAMRAMASRACREITCAVDTRNAPAIAMYEAHGFRSFAERVALVKPLSS